MTNLDDDDAEKLAETDPVLNVGAIRRSRDAVRRALASWTSKRPG